MLINYFETLNIPISFSVDHAQLEKNYFVQQRQFHPDRLVGKTPAERGAALNHSMLVNEAYEALKNPLTCARHMLALRGIQVGSEQDSIKPSHALLVEIMEYREAISEVQSAAALEEWHKKIVQIKVDTILALGRAFASEDLQGAAEHTIRLGYLNKILDDIRVAGKRF